MSCNCNFFKPPKKWSVNFKMALFCHWLDQKTNEIFSRISALASKNTGRNPGFDRELIEDLLLVDLLLEDVGLEDVVLEDVVLEDVVLEDVALQDILLEDVY